MIPHFGLVRQYANLREELLDASDRSLRTGCLVEGPFTDLFEKWLREKTGAMFAVTCHSGTQALEIIARHKAELFNRALNGTVFGAAAPTIQVPNLTYPATMNALINAGWDVELIDTDRNGIGLSPETVLFPGRSECIVGLYGALPNSTNPNWSENAAIVDGAQHWLVAKGHIGYGMAISFDPTKNLPSSGNGGAIVTDNQNLHDYAVNYKNNAKLSNHRTSGTNSKMSEQDCAQILVRTKYIDLWQERRVAIANHWCEAFAHLEYGSPSLRCLSAGISKHAHQKFVIYTEDRVALGAYLAGKGIDCKIHYPYALSELPVAKNFRKPDMLSTSVMLSRGVLSLPIYPELSDTEVEHITAAVKAFFTR